jgi:hypothetical protein
MTTVCGTGGDIRFCGQKQTLILISSCHLFVHFVLHFRLKDRPGRLSFSYADLLAFLFSVDKSIGSGCFFPDLDPSVNLICSHNGNDQITIYNDYR